MMTNRSFVVVVILTSCAVSGCAEEVDDRVDPAFFTGKWTRPSHIGGEKIIYLNIPERKAVMAPGVRPLEHEITEVTPIKSGFCLGFKLKHKDYDLPPFHLYFRRVSALKMTTSDAPGNESDVVWLRLPRADGT